MGVGEKATRGGAAITQAGEKRSAGLESLRALGALGVVVSHVAIGSLAVGAALDAPGSTEEAAAGVGVIEELMLGAGLGAFLFLTLTAYLLSYPFLRRDFGGGRPINLRTYARNRALRILPLYWVVVLAFFAVDQPAANEPGLLAYMTMTQYVFTDAVTGPSSLGPLWTVVVEVHFYILLPFLAWALVRLSGRSMQRAALVVIGLGIASLALRAATVDGIGETSDPFWRLNVPTNFVFFVPGLLLAMINTEIHRTGRFPIIPERLRDARLWVAVAIVLSLVPIYVDYSVMPLIAISSFLLVGACVLPLRRTEVVRVLDWRPMALLGLISGSIYVWHNPTLEFLERAGAPFTPMGALLAITIPVVIGVAALSYRWIEAPFLRMRGRWSADAAAHTVTAPPPRWSPAGWVRRLLRATS